MTGSESVPRICPSCSSNSARWTAPPAAGRRAPDSGWPSVANSSSSTAAPSGASRSSARAARSGSSSRWMARSAGPKGGLRTVPPERQWSRRGRSGKIGHATLPPRGHPPVPGSPGGGGLCGHESRIIGPRGRGAPLGDRRPHPRETAPFRGGRAHRSHRRVPARNRRLRRPASLPRCSNPSVVRGTGL